MEVNNLFKLAREVLKNSYSPYSKFAVGCAIEDDRGKVFIGTNLENVNWSETICAERAAIAQMIADGGKKIQRIVVVTTAKKLVYPCGSCRQVIQEFATENCVVVAASEDRQSCQLIPFTELFPHAFKPGSI